MLTVKSEVKQTALGLGTQNHGYSCRTEARSASNDSLDLPIEIGVWITICQSGKMKITVDEICATPVRKKLISDDRY